MWPAVVVAVVAVVAVVVAVMWPAVVVAAIQVRNWIIIGAGSHGSQTLFFTKKIYVLKYHRVQY